MTFIARSAHTLIATILVAALLTGCGEKAPEVVEPGNPFMAGLNVPVPYGDVTAAHVSEYATAVLQQSNERLATIKAVADPTFDNVVVPLDDISGEISKASSNSWMLYWVSPDEATRDAGIAAYRELDAWNVGLFSDADLFAQINAVADKGGLPAIEEKLVADILIGMKQSGVDLSPADLEHFKALNDEINDLTSQYSGNMNADESMLKLDAEGAQGLPETLTSRYAADDGTFEIPVIAANYSPVVSNADSEATRRSFAIMYRNRAADTNLDILDQLVAKRHELAQLLGYETYADYTLSVKMAGSPDRVWAFLDDLRKATAEKAQQELDMLTRYRSENGGASAAEPLVPWDLSYFNNQLLKTEYEVDREEIRKYFQLDKVMPGMLTIYQELLDLEFRKVENPSVWHESVEMYEVFADGKLKGRFYLDLFPRPNKESHFYGVPLTPGNSNEAGYEVPVAMLLGNFTPGSDDLPSLVSHSELSTVFHEFGHIANSMSFDGNYAMQNGSMSDFGEAMSQIFENWIWDYDTLKGFAAHYETGEVLPEETFQRMLDAKNITSGIGAQSSVMSSVYDMELYNHYDPEDPVPTDQIWRNLAGQFVYSSYIEGTHPQAAWIHINTHPTYYYGYLWSRVYAQDMFTQFEQNGLRDTATGKRYRQIILANGTQRPIEDAVTEFIGRPMNNDAYVRSLGLEDEKQGD